MSYSNIYECPFAYFTSSVSGSSGKRSVITIFANNFPVWLRKIRYTASEAVETCLYNTANIIVVPINNPAPGTQVAGITCYPGAQVIAGNDDVRYQSFIGYRTDTAMGILGTPGFLETAGTDGSLLSVPDKTIIPPYCGLAIATTGTNKTVACAAVGYDIRFGYEIDSTGTPVPRRIPGGRR